MMMWRAWLICGAVLLAASAPAEEFTLRQGELKFRFEGELVGNYDVRRTFDGEIIRSALIEQNGARPKPPAKLPEIDYPHLGTYEGEWPRVADAKRPIELKLQVGRALLKTSGTTNLYYGNILQDAAGDLHLELMETTSVKPIIDLKESFTGKPSTKKRVDRRVGEVVFQAGGAVILNWGINVGTPLTKR